MCAIKKITGVSLIAAAMLVGACSTSPQTGAEQAGGGMTAPPQPQVTQADIAALRAEIDALRRELQNVSQRASNAAARAEAAAKAAENAANKATASASKSTRIYNESLQK